MRIESLQLEQFRNYEELRLTFHPGINVFYGENAQGKTNVLEAIYLCGTTRSHRGSKDRELIRFGQEEAHIRMELWKQENAYRMDMHLKKNRSKGIAVNGIPVKKASELMGIGNFIFFSPEDLQLIKNGPAERRRFLDMELCQLDRMYLQELSCYMKALAQRNSILREISFHPEYQEMLDLWEEQLVQYGKELIARRKRFVDEINQIIKQIHRKLTGEKEELCLVYECSVSQEQFAMQLKKNREKDIRMKLTGTGPHRDDLRFLVQGIDLRRYGSQGQQRTAALSLKLAEIEIVKKKIHDTPVLLLDDVLSELDAGRQHYLLESIHDIQTFLTGTGVDYFVENEFHIDNLIYVKEGNCSLVSPQVLTGIKPAAVRQQEE